MQSKNRQVVSLNGKWDLAFDPDNKGKKEKWFESFPARSKKMSVPGVWEQIKPDYDGVGWYRKTVRIEEGWLEKVVRLEIGAAHYYADVYVNGKQVGSHEGGYTPFVFDITKRLQAGANEIVVRVINPPINEPIEGLRAGSPMNQNDLPIGKAAWYFNFGGIWQDVNLCITEKAYVEDCFVEPFIWKKQAKVNLTLMNSGARGVYEVVCRVSPKNAPAETVAEKSTEATLKKGTNDLSMLLKFADVHLWSDDDPFLYTATIEIVRKDEPVDTHAVTFGMREFTIKNGNFMLNGKKIILKGHLQQGVYPRTLAYPHSEEFARKEMQMLKDAGFNYVRLHLKTAPPISIELADELGILLSEEPPSGWIRNSPDTKKRLKVESREMILRDRNHPSIIMWCLLNEIVNFKGYTLEEKVAMKDELARDARQYDPTRLLIDNAGGCPGAKNPNDQVMRPYSSRQISMLNPISYCQLPLRDDSLVTYRTCGRKSNVVYTPEFGAPEVTPNYKDVLRRYTPAERKLGLEDYTLHKDFYESLKGYFDQDDLKETFGSPEKMIQKSNEALGRDIRHIVAAMRSDPCRDGLTLCQLADASGELFGALDIWREPKPTWFEMSKAVQTPYLSPEILPRVIDSTGGKVEVRATLINENKLGVDYTYALDIVSKGGKPQKSFKGKVRATDGVQTVLLESLDLTLKAGQYALVATLFEKGKVVSKADMHFTVIGGTKIKAPTVGTYDPAKTIGQHLEANGVAVEQFNNGYREKNIPILCDLRKPVEQNHILFETFGQLKKCVQLGGCAILFEANPTALYDFLFPSIIRRECGGMARGIGYIKKHPIFTGLPRKTVMEYEYQHVWSMECPKGEDILEAGGEVISGNLTSNMWTRPARYFWRASTSIVPLGRGHVIMCNLKVLNNLGKDPVADRIFANLINYAKTLIKTGGEEKLLSRPIDPLDPKDYDW